MRKRTSVVNFSSGATTTETKTVMRWHLERRWAPIGCWLNNRWNWRKSRRMRRDIKHWRAMAVPARQVNVDVDPAIRRLAELIDQVPGSPVLDLGYGAGEAVIAASIRAPEHLRPYLDAAQQFDDDELLGNADSANGFTAVAARRELMRQVRSIVNQIPKTQGGDGVAS